MPSKSSENPARTSTFRTGWRTTGSGENNDFGYRKTVSDPDRGTWSFEYNGYGELKSQTDERPKTMSLSYDRLGRVISRSWNENSRSGSGEVAFVESTEYETFATSNQYGTIKKVTRVGGTAGADYERWEREFSYDGLSRAKQSSTTMQAGLSPAITLTTQTKFDSNFGRTKQLVYPASSVDQGSVSIYQAYNNVGALVKEGFAADYVPTDPEASAAIRRLDGVDGRGLLSSESYGVRANGVVDWHSSNLYDSSGWLLAQCASAEGYLCSQEVPTGNTNQPLDQRYRFDVYGNLKTQWHNGQWMDAKGQVVSGARGKEIYSYDALQRLTSATRTPRGGVALPAVTYGYDEIGGLKFKSDYSTTSAQAYQYTGGTHQVHTVALATGGSANYFYDENGNTKQRIENGIETTLMYDIANLPRRIVKNTTSADFYEAQGGRYLQRLVAGGVTRDTYSLEKTYEREVVAGAISVERYYLTSGSLLTIKTDGRKLNYLHTDRLGSPVSITEKVLASDGKLGSETPVIVEHKGFDAFGKALDGQWGTSNFGMLNLTGGQAMNTGKRNQRGFTGHEHLDEFALIHMNGRAYDFNLGRFYGVDPIIQFPGNSQSLNPYAYLMNNPLAGTDPTGYAVKPSGSLCDRPAVDCSSVQTIQINSTATNSAASNGAQTMSGPKTNKSASEIKGEAARSTEVQNLYTPFKGYFSSKFQTAAAEADNPNHTLAQRAVFTVLAASVTVLAMVDSVGEGALNTPNSAHLAGQYLAQGNALSNPHEKAVAYLGAVLQASNAFTGLGNVAAIATSVRSFSPIAAPVQSADDLLTLRQSYVPARVRSRINISNEGMEHLVERHLSGKTNASQFSLPETELRSLLSSRSAVNSPVVRTLNSGDEIRYVREFDVGRTIGADKYNGNQVTSIMSILTDRFGNLVTAFPGVLK